MLTSLSLPISPFPLPPSLQRREAGFSKFFLSESVFFFGEVGVGSNLHPPGQLFPPSFESL